MQYEYLQGDRQRNWFAQVYHQVLKNESCSFNILTSQYIVPFPI